MQGVEDGKPVSHHAGISMYAESIGVRELNRHTSAALLHVRQRHSLTITDRGVPIAHLIPVQQGNPLLTQLVAAGRARAPQITQGPVTMPLVLGDPRSRFVRAICQYA